MRRHTYICCIAWYLSSAFANLEVAQRLFSQRKFADAETVLKKHAKKPMSCEYSVLLGRVKANLGDFKEAERLYRYCIEIDHESEDAHNALAKLLVFQGRFEESSSSFQKVLSLNPDNVEATIGAARAAIALGREKEGDDLYSKALELNPNGELIWFDMGVRAANKGRVDEATERFARARELNPQLDMSLIGKIFSDTRQYRQAADAFKAAIESPNPTSNTPTPVLHMSLAACLEHIGEDQQALEHYRTSISESVANGEPSSPLAHFGAARILTGTGATNMAAVHACGLNEQEALEHLRIAAETIPEAATALKECESQLQEVEVWASRAKAARISQEEGKVHIDEHPSRSVSIGNDAQWVKDVGGFASVPEVVVRSGKEMDEIVAKNKPVVIKNFQDSFAPSASWQWDSLAERWGALTVHASVSQSGRFDGPESGNMWGLSKSNEVLIRPPGANMKFGDYLTLLRANLTETFYLEYLATHQYLGEAVTSMAPLPLPAAESKLELVLTNLWISKGGTVAVLHYDDFENLLCQVKGTKELLLFPPDDINRLYYIARKKGQLEYEYPGTFSRKVLADSPPVVFSSSVNLAAPDFSRHPLFKGLRPIRVVLQPGDTLFMPAFWHHEVRSEGDSSSFPPANIAINFWFRNTTFFANEESGLEEANRHRLSFKKKHGKKDGEL